MPVTPKVYQPDGVLHGGATLALAETVGSFAAHVYLDTDSNFIRGIDISAQHLKSVKQGFIYASAECIHKGRTTQVFSVRVTNEKDQLVTLCKLTTITLPK
ncbi:MAG: PaaI family thioesterase, partial [Bacteroidota bacterium]|nr:PaaI family thioesterase [Bacteroidota bacterium]